MERSMDEEDEKLWEQWQDMKDAQLGEDEEEMEYSAADDQYDDNWDDELWEEEQEYEVSDEEIVKKTKKRRIWEK